MDYGVAAGIAGVNGRQHWHSGPEMGDVMNWDVIWRQLKTFIDGSDAASEDKGSDHFLPCQPA